MKAKFLVLSALLLSATMTSGNKDENKLIKGEWCNPYTYQSTGEIKGFNFQKGGKCSGINIPTLDLKTWKIEDGKLIISGFYIDENGSKSDYQTSERIEKLTKDSLIVIAKEKNPKLVFVYVRPTAAKKAYAKGSVLER